MLKSILGFTKYSKHIINGVAVFGPIAVKLLSQKLAQKLSEVSEGAPSGATGKPRVNPSLEPVVETIKEKVKEAWEKVKPDLKSMMVDAVDSLLGEVEKGLCFVVDKVASFFSSFLRFA